MQPPDEFDLLLRFLQDNQFKVILVEGPRGCGKTTFVNRLLDHTTLQYYKTWGKDQRTDRFKYADLGLELPQATFFVLDFLSQVQLPDSGVLCDRANLSAVVYQWKKYRNSSLQTYYLELMKRSSSLLLYLDADPEELYRRRVSRKDDEQGINTMELERGRAIVIKDWAEYHEGLSFLCGSGLTEIFSLELGSTTCYGYIPKGCSFVPMRYREEKS